MSIATEITRLQTAKSDIKEAIEGKGVTVGNVSLSEYAGKIEQISGGAEEAPENDVNFYDYDGFRVASYTIEEAKALTALPTPPSHDGLTFQEWNWTLSDIQTYDRQYIDVGANYITTDGNTHLKIKVAAGETISFSLTMDSGCSVVVDYGDGEQSPSTTGTAKVFGHTYITAGLYDIKIIPSGTALFGFVNAHVWVSNFYEINIGNSFAFKSTSNGQNLTGLLSLPTSVDIEGCDFRFSTFPLLAIPKGNHAFSSNNALSRVLGKISFPRQITSMTPTAFLTLLSLDRLVLPETTSGVVAVNSLNSNFYIRVLSLPNSFQFASSNSNYFSNNQNMQELDIVQGWTPLYSMTLYNNNAKWPAYNMVKLFNKLGTTSTAITLTFGSTNLNKLTAEQKAIATDKGYTLA